MASANLTENTPSPIGRVVSDVLCTVVLIYAGWMAFVSTGVYDVDRDSWRKLFCAAAVLTAITWYVNFSGRQHIRGTVRAMLKGILIGIWVVIVLAIVLAWHQSAVAGKYRGGFQLKSAIFYGIPWGASLGCLIGFVSGLVRSRRRSATPARRSLRPAVAGLVVLGLALLQVAPHLFHFIATARLGSLGAYIGVRPAWFPRFVGELDLSRFGPVVEVRFENGATDSTVALLRHVPEIQALSLADCGITNEGLRHVGALPNLSWLDLRKTRVSDQGLAHLASLAALRQVDLSETDVAGHGLAALQTSGVGLAVLCLRGSKITDEGLAHVPNLPGLAYLDLGETAVSDEGLRHVAKCTSLRHLELKHTSVSDAGLAHLAKLKSPPMLIIELHGTQVTSAGVERLRAAWPRCTVAYETGMR